MTLSVQVASFMRPALLLHDATASSHNARNHHLRPVLCAIVLLDVAALLLSLQPWLWRPAPHMQHPVTRPCCCRGALDGLACLRLHVDLLDVVEPRFAWN